MLKEEIGTGMTGEFYMSVILRMCDGKVNLINFLWCQKTKIGIDVTGEMID